MSKKRIDNRRDDTTAQRVSGVLRAAATTTVGAALFFRYGARDFSAASKTYKNIKASMSGKQKNLSNILDSLDNHIGYKGAKYKELKNSTNGLNYSKNTVELNSSKQSPGIGNVITSIVQNTKSKRGIKQDMASKQLDRLKTNLLNKISDELNPNNNRRISQQVADKDRRILEEMIETTFTNGERLDTIYTKNGELVIDDNYFKKSISQLSKNVREKKITLTNHDGKQEEVDFIKHILETSKASRTAFEEDYKKNKKNVENFLKKTNEVLENVESMSSYLGTKENNKFTKFNSFIKKITGYEVDSENLLYGSRAATIEDVYEEILAQRTHNKRKTYNKKIDFTNFNSIYINDKNKQDVLRLDDYIYNKMQDKNFAEKAKDINFGHGLRISTDKDGNKYFHSVSDIENTFDDALHSFSETILGGIYKTMDFYQTKHAPYSHFLKRGKLDALAKYEYDNTTNRMNNSYYYVGGKFHQITGDYFDELDIKEWDIKDKRYLVSMEHGSLPKMLTDMYGTDRHNANTIDNLIAKKLDFGQNPAPNIFQRIYAHLTKHNNPNWEKNMLDDARVLFINSSLADDQDPETVYKTMEVAHKAFKQYSNLNTITDETITKLLDDYTLSPEIENIIKPLLYNNNGDKVDLNYIDIFKSLTDRDFSNVTANAFDNLQNKNLKELYYNMATDAEAVDRMLEITSVTTYIPVIGIDGITRTTALDINDIARQEVLKEALLRQHDILTIAEDGTRTNDFSIFDYIDIMDHITDKEKLDLKALASTAFMENRLISDVPSSIYQSAVNTKNNLVNINDITHNMKIDMFNTLDNIMEVNNSIGSKPYFGNMSETYLKDTNLYMTMKKSNLSEMLLDLNLSSPGEAATGIMSMVGQFFKESFAGRKNTEDVTALTMIPYNFLSRLSYGVEELGLSLSSNSMGSTLDIGKNILLKRALPVMAAYTVYDYLDYEAENFTGTSITSALAHGVKNIDIVGRHLTAPINWLIDGIKETSVIGEYLTGSNEFQTAAERKEWYENGYSPVRESRFWSFGSASEFRGGGIAYWQPNFVRRAESNYNEIGIYGSAEEKFKHSLIPSLRHPLSTINFLLDPYWLEKKNIDSRPYPYTGKLFSEGTAWGAILNPTIGELIKPVKMLPEIKDRLSGHVDLSAMLSNMNERIHNRENVNDKIISINGTDISNREFVPMSRIERDSISLDIVDGNVLIPNDLSFVEDTVTNVKDIDISTYAYGNGSGQQKSLYPVYSDGNISSSEGNNILTKIVNDFSSSTNIDLSKLLKANNTNYSNNLVNSVSLMQEGAVITINPVANKINSLTDYYSFRKDNIALGTSYREDLLNDAIYSVKQLGGIYSFFSDLAIGEQSYKLRMESAGNMYSFNRSFWDASVGGLGGDFMEIARRFFPHEDRSRPAYNPLENNMPGWIPKNFHKGDPYTKLPKGEARLPGKGYEAIYDLHPDEFANDGYGAFDRFKILADIAPSSEEYKIWKQIAKKTVQDPELQKEMKEIEYRAKKAMSNHDFYEYRYFNNKTDKKIGYIKTIDEEGIITLSNNQKIKMAGIITNLENISTQLQAGQKIVYETTKNEKLRYDDEYSSAIIHKSVMGFQENVNKTLLDSGLAEENKLDDSNLAPLAKSNNLQETIGGIQEIIAHARIPFIHNKFLHIESSFESYKNEMVYGTQFQTWDNPVESFIKPAMYEQARKSVLGQAASIFAFNHFEKAMKSSDNNKKIMATIMGVATNPSATLFGSIAGISKMKIGPHVLKAAKFGQIAGMSAWANAHAANPFVAVPTYSLLARQIAENLDVEGFVNSPSMKKTIAEITKHGDVLEPTIKNSIEKLFINTFKDIDKVNNRTFGRIGAKIGIGMAILKNPDFDFDRLTGTWIPDNVEERWNLEEYNDRIAYVKYSGLYQAAARKAEKHEGINIRKIIKELDERKKEAGKLKRDIAEYNNKSNLGKLMDDTKITDKKKRLEEIELDEQVLLGGKWTKAAVAYKKMAESTLYGLEEGASFDEIIRATPNQYKDFMSQFIKEKDEKKRKEILKTVSPQMKRALQIAWGEKPDHKQSNLTYFKYNKMPSSLWRGWKPNTNLKHVHMKTIENEGMALSDFGYYESEKAKASYHEAPEIYYYNQKSKTFGLGSAFSLAMNMGGFGLGMHNVSVETTDSPGVTFIGEIEQTIREGKHILSSKLDGFATNLFL